MRIRGHKRRNVRGTDPCCQTQVLAATGDLPLARAHGRLGLHPARPLSLTAIYVLLLLLALAALLLFALRRRGGRRQRALAQVLDAADALEARLRTARAEIEAIAGSGGNPVQDAMQEMLRQRLWLQQHGQEASLEQLAQVRDSIDDGRRRIDQQLARIDRARSPTVH